MESNWRYNVADQGLAGLNVVLLARLLSPLGREWLQLTIDSAGRSASAFDITFVGDQMTFTNILPIVTSASPFPFGLAVEPDHV